MKIKFKHRGPERLHQPQVELTPENNYIMLGFRHMKAKYTWNTSAQYVGYDH